MRVSFFKPLPDTTRTDYFDVNPQITKVDISTELPGGFKTCVLSLTEDTMNDLYYPQFPGEEVILPNGRLLVEIGDGTIFDGAITKIVDVGGIITEITATGYAIFGLNMDWYKNNEVNVSSSTTQIQSTQRTSGQLIAEAVAAAAPLIQIGNSKEFLDPKTLVIPGSFYGQTPAQIIEAVTKFGSSLNLVWDMYVYEDRVLNLKPRQIVDAADYSIPFDKSTTRTREYSKITGSVRTEFKLPDWDNLDKELLVPDHNNNYQTSDQVNNQFPSLYGIMRKVYLKGGILTANIADQYTRTYLLENSVPEIGIVVTRDEMRGMENTLGGETPNYNVRSGQWVIVGDLAPLIIIRTRWTNDGKFTCELGKSAQHWEAFISYLSEISRHVVESTNPLTGMRV